MSSVFENMSFWVTLMLLNKAHVRSCEVASRQVLVFFCTAVHPSATAYLSPLTTHKSETSYSEVSKLGGLPAKAAGFRSNSFMI